MLLPLSKQYVRLIMLAVSVCGVVILFVSTKNYLEGFNVRRKGPLTTTQATFRQLYSTSNVMYGAGNQSSNDQDIVDDIRSQISKPSPNQPRKLARPHITDASQVGQSAFVDKILSGRRNGFFIECGAVNGETYSNSLFFELQRNWTGLLIEGNPRYHRSMLKKNRRAYMLNACLSTEQRPMTVRFRSRGLLSGIVGKIHGKMRGRDVTVKCFPLNSIMEALGVSHVDYLSLDVEGPELEILRTVDFTRLRIDIMTVEYRMGPINLNLKKLNDLRQFFRDTGIYREVGVLPKVNESVGLDVIFSRV